MPSEIIDKVQAGVRLSLDDGLTLWHSPDVWSVCELANLVRQRLHGNNAYYNINRHLNYTNICALSCSFCSFYRKKDDEGAYEYSLESIGEDADKARAAGATEIHIVGGLHPWLPFSYYIDMLHIIRERAPKIHIKAFTAVEIVHLAKISKRPKDIAGVLQDLKDAGLGSLPGGGAEVFDDRVHKEAFRGKIGAAQWLDVHHHAHQLGLNTNTTLLYGHIESIEDRIQHLTVLRQEQDRALAKWAHNTGRTIGQNGEIILTGPEQTNSDGTILPTLPEPDTCQGYFQTITPLPFIPDDSKLEHLPGPSGRENLRMIAVSRLMLDNFPHVKAFWIMQTLEMAEFMLTSGADDIDGTVCFYDITKVGSGTTTHQITEIDKLRRSIREAGFNPVERDTLYRTVTRNGADWKIRTTSHANV